jgi:hypothetical protein
MATLLMGGVACESCCSSLSNEGNLRGDGMCVGFVQLEECWEQSNGVTGGAASVTTCLLEPFVLPMPPMKEDLIAR